MTTVCQFFYYTPSHDLQSLLPLPYTLVTTLLTIIVIISGYTIINRMDGDFFDYSLFSNVIY